VPVSLNHMRDLMLPGLRASVVDVVAWDNALVAAWDGAFRYPLVRGMINDNLYKAAFAPSLPVALAMGAAAAVIKNPVVPRRFLFSWLNKELDICSIGDGTCHPCP
jgi:hypothetical protein